MAPRVGKFKGNRTLSLFAPRVRRSAPRRPSPASRVLFCVALALSSAFVAAGQTTYKKPPKEVLDVLNAPVTPSASISPTREHMLLATGVRYPPIAELAQPMLRLAGL